MKGRWKYTLFAILAFEIIFRILTEPYAINTNYFNWSFASRAFDYVLGTILGVGITAKNLRFFSSKAIQLVSKISIIGAFLLMGITTGWIDNWATPILYSAIYYLVLTFFSESPFFTNRISVFLGRIDYSWYLYGWAITYFLFINRMLSTSFPFVFFSGFAIFVGSIMISWVSFKYFEKPKSTTGSIFSMLRRKDRNFHLSRRRLRPSLKIFRFRNMFFGRDPIDEIFWTGYRDRKPETNPAINLLNEQKSLVQ